MEAFALFSPNDPITHKLIYEAVFERLSGDHNMSRSAVLDLVIENGRGSEKEILDLFRAWTIPVLKALGEKSPSRFNELKRKIKNVSSTSLSERLSSLEGEGILQRVVIPETPPRVEYSLTAKGMELYTIVVELGDWQKRWGKSGNN